MPTVSTNTTISLPAGALLMFKAGGAGRAIDGAGNVYILGLNDIQVGPAPKAQTVQVLVTSGTLAYEVDSDAVRDEVQYVEITADTTLTTAHNGKVLRLDAARTLTVPEGLGTLFSCIVMPPASGNASVARSGTVTLNGASTTLTRSRSSNPAGFVIQAHELNVFGVSGS